MALITMSKKELGRLETLVGLDAGRITAAQATQLIGVGERQVFRLLRAYRTSGTAGLTLHRRGRPSRRRKASARTATAWVTPAGRPPQALVEAHFPLGPRSPSLDV